MSETQIYKQRALLDKCRWLSSWKILELRVCQILASSNSINSAALHLDPPGLGPDVMREPGNWRCRLQIHKLMKIGKSVKPGLVDVTKVQYSM